MRHSRLFHVTWFLFILAVLFAIGALITMSLWNAIIPETMGFSTLNYWQALGLQILGLTLSGTLALPIFALGHTLHPHHQRRQQLMEKWNRMNDEQRKEFLSSRGFSIHNDD